MNGIALDEFRHFVAHRLSATGKELSTYDEFYISEHGVSNDLVKDFTATLTQEQQAAFAKVLASRGVIHSLSENKAYRTGFIDALTILTDI